MPDTSPRKRFASLSLQKKIMGLVLIPLLVVTTLVVAINTYGRIQDTRATLAEERELLIESRKQAVKNVVETAKSAIAPIVAQAGPNDRAAKSRARDLLRELRFDDNNYIFAVTYDGQSLVLPHKQELEGSNMWDSTDAGGQYFNRDMIEIAQNGGGFYRYQWEHPATDQPEVKYSYAAGIPEWGWMLGAGVYITEINATMAKLEASAEAAINSAIWRSIIIGLVMFALVGLIGGLLVRRTVRPIQHTAAAMKDIARGRGDLTRRLAVESRDEVGELANQFNAFVARMQDTLREVRSSTGSVNLAAGEIAQGSQELSSRTEQAAANLQQTSASMEEITSTVQQSTDSAHRANELAQSTSTVAGEGEQAMGRVEHTMGNISDSAARISEIITMIDSIAFQTNILALNASVEAARAGEHGRGFAVVAQEVRTLASRSSNASQEIRELIDAANRHTGEGTELVRSAGDTMRNIVASVNQVSSVIAEITASAQEQSAGIGQVNTAVAEMDTMTQQNASMVQQTSSAADAMQDQAQRLDQLIGSFVLDDATRTGVAAPPATPRMPSRAPAPASSSDNDDWETF